MDPDTMQLSASVIDMIREGDMDEALGDIQAAISLRRSKIEDNHYNGGGGQLGGGGQKFRRGQRIKITSHTLRPKYLYGKEFTVKKVNTKTVVVDFPIDSGYGRFSGSQGVRVPKSCVSVLD
jgi:hypothetical protein